MKIESSYSLQQINDYLPSKEKVLKTAKAVLISTIAVQALASIPAVAGGPIAHAACITACVGVFPALLPGCILACAPVLALPTP